MIIDCISDLHGYYPELEGGDLLIVAGDLTARDTNEEYTTFELWLATQPYRKKVIIAGNHDNKLKNKEWMFALDGSSDYLCDSATEFEGLKIWGSPWTKTFPGMNPRCKAFTYDTEEKLAEKWALIPDDVDILITHSPMYNYLDICWDLEGKPKHCGSPSLRLRTREIMINGGAPIKLHVFGHIHEGYGQEGNAVISKRINASHVNERYEPVNKPIRVIL